jgi:hypothetical protein
MYRLLTMLPLGHRGVTLVIGVCLVSMPSLSCITSELTPLSNSQRPSRPTGCPLQIFPTTQPPYPHENVASVRVACDPILGRAPCIDALEDKACHAGADTIYGMQKGIAGDSYMFFTATLANRTNTQTPAAGTSACSPICSPGFDCQAGRCIPVCNPPCETGEVCNRKRTCERAAAAAANP